MTRPARNLRAIFSEAIATVTSDDLTAYLDEVCGSDGQLRSEIESLVAAHHKAGVFLHGLLENQSVPGELPMVEAPGTVIGRYKLLERIGEGGMAVVYMAGQERPIRRKVALKIIKLGMDTKSVIARFEAERQALAMMDHPHIAKVFDAGATETGRPYFVMEMVTGVSITEYCDKNSLGTKERLGLFIQVCNAVQHAHQKGIIHRDIKPSNVMVTLHDGRPVPKVIDFGIAKATDYRLTEKTVFTRYSQIIGTPAYMSPEQAEMSELDVDTRTDIYSLGVLLYELLTGSTPFAAKTLLKDGYTEMQRIIRESEPLKPSTRIRTLGQTLTDVATSRQASPELLRRLVKGDLDWIVMKTLEKDRVYRYETAHALAEDIERHLRNEPITAASPGAFYRVQKFLRRHRVQVLTWSALAVIVVGLLLVTFAYVRFRTERIRSDHLKSIALVEDLIAGGGYQRALSEIKPVLSSRFVGPEARLLHARVLLELQSPDASVEQLLTLLQERSEIAANAHFLLAWIYLESASGDTHMKNKAEVHLQQGERLLPRTAEAYLLRAMTAQTVQGTLGWLNDALQLNPAHYGARRARALTYYALGEYRDMETEASVMIGSQPQNPAGYSLRAIARREVVLAQNDGELLNEALADHNRAAGLTSPPDKHLADIYNQRRHTLMRMGKYDQALTDARTCLKIEPVEPIYHFNLFCVFVALGNYDKAQAEYDNILELGLMDQMRLDCSAAKYVFDSLWSGESWHPQGKPPTGTAFAGMHKAAEEYGQLAGRARRIVAEGFHPSFSPDGTRLAYSRGVLGASGIEILHLETGQTRLLTVPGKDPAWSPDGQYIVYVRDRQVLSLKDLTEIGQGEHQPWEQEEVWIIRADGKDRPRFLARGGWPNWSRDSSRVYYHSRLNNMICSVSADPNNANPKEIVACDARFPVVSPDEKYVAFMEEEKGIFKILDLSSKSVAAVWPGPNEKGQLFINWSADGRRLAIGCFWHGGLWIYDMETMQVTKVIDGSFSWCSWSGPDMSRIAIERVYGPWHHEIWIADNVKDGVPAAIQKNKGAQK
ncbi:MAG: protein kinase [Candidatus Zixiibacteriota bacterium]|nr:MAG: protein kinase [candidate division Zixibacteria bacterium]